jgi:adenine-specific DNA-methyltransferase
MSDGNIITKLLTPLIIKNNLNENEFILEGEWRYSQNKINEILKNDETIVISKIPFRPNHIKNGGEIKKMKNNFSPIHYEMETNEDATEQIISLLKVNLFDNHKPVKLIQTLIKAITYVDKNDLILDFFSGSATTAHAVMKLNSEDGGERRYILVQLPEPTDPKSEANRAGYKNICEIGKERIRRAGEKISEELREKSEELVVNSEELREKSEELLVNSDELREKSEELLVNSDELDIGFKVFKLDSSNIKEWDPDYKNIKQSLLETVDNIKDDRTEDDLLYEILLKYGLDLTLPIEELELAGKRVYVVGLGALVVCLDEQITLDTVEAIAKLKEQYSSDEVMRVVFRDNGFKNAEVKTNAIQILKQFGIEDVRSL